MYPWMEFEKDLVGYLGILSALIALISGGHYLIRQKRGSWGYLLLLLSIIGLLAKEIMGVFVQIPYEGIAPGPVPLDLVPLHQQGLSRLVDIFAELCIAIGFWRLFVVEQDREKQKMNQLENRAAGLQSLSNSLMGISGSLQLPIVLESVAREALSLLNADISLITVNWLDIKPRILLRKTGLEISDHDAGHLEKTIQWLIEKDESLIIENIGEYERGSRVREHFPVEVNAVISLPLRSGEKRLGIMLLAFNHARQIDPNEHYQLNMLVTQALLAIRNAELYLNVERLSLTDPLTGLGNRRAFEQRVLDELHRARRYKRNLSLMMADIDDFKNVNDAHGHPVGDQVIKAVAQRLQGELREVDFVGRLGGEEYILILPETDATEAAETAERLRKCIAGTPIATEHEALWVTISLGVITNSGEQVPDDPQQFYEQVDQALYLAKNLGKNQVQVYQEDRKTA